MGYPSDILSTRAVIRPGKYVVIPPEGLVNNVIPGIENCRVSIVASPKYGASFVQYLITAQPGGGTSRPSDGRRASRCSSMCWRAPVLSGPAGKNIR